MKWLRIFLLTISALILSACSFTLAADVTPPPGYRQPTPMEAPVEATSGPMFPLVPPDAKNGEPIFAEKCAPCHGVEGLGDGPQAAQLPNPVIPIGTYEISSQVSPADWDEIVSKGNIERFMPPFTSLTDRQRWDVVAYTYSLSTSAERIATGEALFQENCASCHGSSGLGDGPSAAGMTLPNFTNQELMAGKSGAELFQTISAGSGEMPAFSEDLSEDERWVLTDYLRSLTFTSAMLADQSTQSPDAQTTPMVETPSTSEVEPDDVITETAVLAEPSGMGIVNGYVMNASGGDIPAGTEVLLHGFDQMQIAITATTQLLDDGTYSFTDVEMPIGRVFLTTIDFEGTSYGSDIATVEGDEQIIELPIQIYETTTDTSSIFADRMHMFFEQLDDQTMRVVELYIISNPSNKTIIASEDGAPVLEFSLPPEARNLEFQDDTLGDRYIETDKGFADTIPIRPGMGSYQVLFSYEMPFERNLELVHPVNMQTDALVILVPEDSVKIKGANIQDAGVRDMQGVTYHMYNGSAMNAGENLSLTVSGRSSTSINLSSSSGMVIGIAALGLVLIVAGVFLYRRAGSNDEYLEDDEYQDVHATEPQNAEAVMDAILALDDLFQEGQLPEDAYHKRRAELKAQLQKLMEGESA